MDISPVPLVEFYKNLLPEAQSVGYKLVLTALAREADAPDFYQDLKRYWSSLHDATGPDVLFIFAGANAAGELHSHGLADRRKPVAYGSPHLAFEGTHARKGRMHWRGRARQPASDERFRFGRPRLDHKDDVATNHTLEVGALSHYLDIPESRLPCLVFTLLVPRNDRPLRVSVPWSTLQGQTIYLYVKRVAAELQNSFQQIDASRKAVRELRAASEEAQRPIRQLQGVRRSARQSAALLDSPGARDAVAEILDLTGAASRSLADKARCFTLFSRVKASRPTQDHVVKEVQRLINLSFLQRAQDSVFDENDALLCLDLSANRVLDLEAQEWLLWSHIRDTLSRTIQLERQTVDESWDFFIAYSSEDRALAERIYTELSAIGRPFIDCRCLRPGDHWTERIRSAQSRSKGTILLVTRDMPQSWFAESEYLHAIQLMRKGSHVVIPVLFGNGVQMPYGLEQVHGAVLQGWDDLGRLPDLVRHVLG